ncbi:uncharacterized protein EAE98_011566 [Botrytis deweyae]|uniref:Uncharacterized protein n=1 Tax=Botrytis deweyae TaxID=2478750 RepID=A0ABQ7I5B9_9HELO|nr:uncharacterized protein EAE98_011566 [Botrytis deweyae]KAF7913341.1 hypothetical protein EAE98_011566 [Botrytis deweyae]
MVLGGVWGKQLENDPLDPKMSQIDSVPVLRFAPPEIKYDENVATCMKSMQGHHKLADLLLLANHRHPFLYIVPLSRTPRKFITESPLL